MKFKQLKTNKQTNDSQNIIVWQNQVFTQLVKLGFVTHNYILTDFRTNQWWIYSPNKRQYSDSTAVAEFRSVVKDTKSNTKNITKSISIHSAYQSVHFW